MRKRVLPILHCFCMVMLLLQAFSVRAASGTPDAKARANADLYYAKIAFKTLTSGAQSAQAILDWENFQAMGTNVGAMYRTMPNTREKAAFRKSFISSFASSFKKTGARASALTNWQVKQQDAAKTIVVADTPRKRKILITVVRRNGKQKISAINPAP